MKKPIIINLSGGPGVGKSTLALEITTKLKKEGYNVEFVFEHAKDLTHSERWNCLSNQLFVFAEQYRRIEILKNYDYIIVDSPLLLSAVYNDIYNNQPYQKELDALILTIHNDSNFININFVIKRNPSFIYNEMGRNQKLEEAKKIDETVENKYIDNNINYKPIISGEEAFKEIMKDIHKMESEK
jgi:thymidylate kinase